MDTFNWVVAVAAAGAVPMLWVMLNVNCKAQQRTWPQ